MKSRNEILLLGNGINYLSSNSISWSSLLEELAEDVGYKNLGTLIREKPFTLIYEEIIFKSNTYDSKSEIDIKRKVAKLVNKIKSNNYHTELLDSKYQHILTTNYDYALETSVSKEINKQNIKRETKYNLYRRNKVNSKYIWHIHGECNVPNSITLGHEQYAGQLQKMRHYATANRTKKFGAASQFKMNNLNFDKDGSDYSWIDLFLRDDVHIVGLSLDYTEIDLWWLLSYKKRLQQIKKYNVGQTYFHTQRSSEKKQLALISILESFGLRIKYHSSYKSMYSSIIKG